MKKTLDNLIITGALAISLWGFRDLMIPRDYGFNRVELALMATSTEQAPDYARKTIPGAVAFYGGALVYSVYDRMKRFEVKK